MSEAGEKNKVVGMAISFSSVYAFVFINLFGLAAAEEIGFAQVIIAFTTSLFDLMTPTQPRLGRYSWVGSIDLYRIANIVAVVSLAYAVAFAFGIYDAVSATIAVISVFTLYALYVRANIPKSASAILVLSIVGGFAMFMLDVAQLAILRLLAG